MLRQDLSEKPVLGLTWAEFYDRVRTSETPEVFQNRLTVINTARDLFSSVSHFCDLDRSDRRKIGGFRRPSEVGYGMFGGLGGGGTFQSVVNQNNPNLSAALDKVPLQGEITKLTYLAFVCEFKNASPSGGGGISAATRLLAMKRPDSFVRISERNRELFCEDFQIAKGTGLDNYWERVIDPIMKSPWWNSAMPDTGDEQEVWKARAAFLDAIFRRE